MALRTSRSSCIVYAPSLVSTSGACHGKFKLRHSFEYLISEDINEPLHSNRLLSPGETAEFYVKLLYSDGRASKPSNIVKVTAPQKK